MERVAVYRLELTQLHEDFLFVSVIIAILMYQAKSKDFPQRKQRNLTQKYKIKIVKMERTPNPFHDSTAQIMRRDFLELC